jgi:uncharacterized protein (DUF433 family)
MSAQIPTKVYLRKYIDTSMFEERPHIRGRRIPVALLVRVARNEKWDIDEIADQYSISTAEALAAMLYYEEHKEEIERQEEVENAKFDEMKRLAIHG